MIQRALYIRVSRLSPMFTRPQASLSPLSPTLTDQQPRRAEARRPAGPPSDDCRRVSARPSSNCSPRRRGTRGNGTVPNAAAMALTREAPIPCIRMRHRRTTLKLLHPLPSWTSNSWLLLTAQNLEAAVIRRVRCMWRVETVQCGCQTGVRRVSDGCQTGFRQVSDGRQMGVRWALDKRLDGYVEVQQ